MVESYKDVDSNDNVDKAFAAGEWGCYDDDDDGGGDDDVIICHHYHHILLPLVIFLLLSFCARVNHKVSCCSSVVIVRKWWGQSVDRAAGRVPGCGAFIPYPLSFLSPVINTPPTF